MTTRAHSFGFALRGLALLVRTQANARIHLAISSLVIAAGLAFGISLAEWSLIVFALVSVWVTEALNTSIEFLVDLLSPEIHPLAASAKDLAAGAVLIAAIGSAIVGVFVFAPRIIALAG